MLEWFKGGLDLLQVALVRDEFFKKHLAQTQRFWRAEVDVFNEETCRIGVIV